MRTFLRARRIPSASLKKNNFSYVHFRRYRRCQSELLFQEPRQSELHAARDPRDSRGLSLAPISRERRSYFGGGGLGLGPPHEEEGAPRVSGLGESHSGAGGGAGTFGCAGSKPVPSEPAATSCGSAVAIQCRTGARGPGISKFRVRAIQSHEAGGAP